MILLKRIHQVKLFALSAGKSLCKFYFLQLGCVFLLILMFPPCAVPVLPPNSLVAFYAIFNHLE